MKVKVEVLQVRTFCALIQYIYLRVCVSLCVYVNFFFFLVVSLVGVEQARKCVCVCVCMCVIVLTCVFVSMCLAVGATTMHDGLLRRYLKKTRACEDSGPQF